MLITRTLALPLLLVCGLVFSNSAASSEPWPTDQTASPARAKVTPPLLSWADDASFPVDSLGGLPVASPEMAIGANSSPWLFVLVNQGIGSGIAVKALKRDASGWRIDETLGTAYFREGEAQNLMSVPWFRAASSAGGPAVVWRSAAGEITLAVENQGTWTRQGISVPPEQLDRASTESWGELWRRQGMTTLTLKSELFGFGAAWRLRDGSTEVTSMAPPAIEAVAGNEIQPWTQTLWFDTDGRLHTSYFELPIGTGQRAGVVVDRVLDEGSNAWLDREVVSEGVVSAGRVRSIIVDGMAGLLWDARDRRFGSDSQIEGAWRDKASWTEIPSIPKASIVGLPAVGTSAAGCLYTTTGYVVIDPFSAPVRLKAGRSSLFQRGPINAYQLQGDFCLMPYPGAPAASATWATQLTGFPRPVFSAAGTATADTAFTAVNNERGVRMYALSISPPAAPGPVQDLQIQVRQQGAKRVVLSVQWGEPVPTPYPSANYRFRWTAEKRWSRWYNTGSTRKYVIVTSPGKVVRIEVRAENSFGTSTVARATYRS